MPITLKRSTAMGTIGLVVAAGLASAASFTSIHPPDLTGRTITVTANALDTSAVTTPEQISINLNVNSMASATSALTLLNQEAARIRKAVERIGLAASAITVNGQNFNLEVSSPVKDKKLPRGVSANDTVTINVSPAQTALAFTAIESAMASFSGHGNDNAYVNQPSLPAGSNIGAVALKAAITAATREATAIAAEMDVRVGPIVSATQESYNGTAPVNPNQVGISLQVVFSTRS